MNEVTAIEYEDGCVYRIVFDDETSGSVDSSGYPSMGPVFEPLRNLRFLRKARIEGGTIAWPNGADIAPESLYGKLSCSRSE